VWTSAAGTTIYVPPVGVVATWVVTVLTALVLIGRFVVRPAARGARYVKGWLAAVAANNDQVAEIVQYFGLFGADVEARLDRIEERLDLGYWKPTGQRHGPPTLHAAIEARLETQARIRELGDDERGTDP
jgi:hypothetical protein